MQEVVDDDGLEDVEFEVALRSGEADGGVVAHHLAADHGHGFALGRVHFARHDGRAGFVFRDGQFTESAARSAGQPTDVVGDFHQRAGEGLQCAGGEDEFVVGGESGELVGIRGEGETGEVGDFLRGAVAEFGVRVESGADGGAADAEGHDAGEGRFDAREVGVEKRDVAGEFLSEGDRGGVLQVGAADFDDVGESLGFGVERVAEFADGGKQFVHDDLGRGDGHGGREGVVRRLRHVDVVVGMDGGFRPHLAAGHFDGAVGDDLVGVHVALRAGAGLPDAEREMVVELAGDDFVGGLRDELGFVGGEFAEVLIDEGAGFFEDAEGADELARFGVVADVEVDEGTGGLRAVVAVGGNVDRPHGVGFGAGFHGLRKESGARGGT